jgi:hypothetical protein
MIFIYINLPWIYEYKYMKEMYESFVLFAYTFWCSTWEVLISRFVTSIIFTYLYEQIHVYVCSCSFIFIIMFVYHHNYIDFGVAYVQPDDASEVLTSRLASGTKQYLAPEVFCKRFDTSLYVYVLQIYIHTNHHANWYHPDTYSIDPNLHFWNR